MAGLEYFDAFYQIEQVTQFIVIRDVQFGGSGNQQFAHPMTAIVNTDFMRKACRNFGRFQDIVNELTNIINLPRTLTDMSFFLQDARMILFHKCHTTGGRTDDVIVFTEQIVKTECQFHRFIFKTGICHRLSATSLIQRIIDVYSQTFQ